MSGFLGTGWSFPPRFAKSAGVGGVAMVSDELDIEESLRILVGTRRGEREFFPEYGLDLHELVFEPMSTTMRALLEERVKLAILVHEPRIEPFGTRVLSVDPHGGRLDIEIDYRVRATNSRYNLVFPFYASDSNEIARGAGQALAWTSSKA